MIMKRFFALCAALVLMGTAMYAQNVQETTVEIGEKKSPAFTVSLQQDADMVQGALTQMLKESKLKTKKVDGYVACIDQVVSALSTSSVNFYSKVEEQGRKSNRTTTVTFCVMANDLTLDQTALSLSTRKYLEDFVGYVARYEAQGKLSAEQDKLKKAQKEQKSATSELESLDKSIAADQKKIEERKSEIEKLQKKIADYEKEVSQLESRVNKNSGQRGKLESKVDEANRAVKGVEDEVERYRQQLQ